MYKRQRLFCLAIALICLGATARADDIAQAGRAVLKKYQDAVVTVRVVAKISIPGRESSQEAKIDVVGLTVDATGLVVASLSGVDPSAKISHMAGREVQTEIADVKIVLADRTEIPAALVLRDKDLDLAFVRPTEKLAKPATFIPLTATARPEVLDQVIILARNLLTHRLEPIVGDVRIAAIADKPRLFYIGTPALQFNTPGSAVFSLDGQLLGQLLIQRGAKSTWGVIIPAADIADSAKQAPAEAPKAPAPAAEEKEKKPAPAPAKPKP